MQYYTKRPVAYHNFKQGINHMLVFTRDYGDIPGILKAQDVFVEEDGHLVIKNPSKPDRPAY